MVLGRLAGNSLKIGRNLGTNEKLIESAEGVFPTAIRSERLNSNQPLFFLLRQLALRRNRVCLNDSRSRSIPISTMHSSTLTSASSLGARIVRELKNVGFQTDVRV